MYENSNISISMNLETCRLFNKTMQKLSICCKLFDRDSREDDTSGTTFSRNEISGIHTLLEECLNLYDMMLCNAEIKEIQDTHTA